MTLNKLHLIIYLILAAVLMYMEYPMILSILVIAWGFISVSGHLDDDWKGGENEQTNNAR